MSEVSVDEALDRCWSQGNAQRLPLGPRDGRAAQNSGRTQRSSRRSRCKFTKAACLILSLTVNCTSQWHPSRPLIVSVSSLGFLHIWTTVTTENWSAYAPGFEELDENIEYEEKEDEFDIVGRAFKANDSLAHYRTYSCRRTSL